jgi:uncharacterized membrane protein YecN with MAPEG domain
MNTAIEASVNEWWSDLDDDLLTTLGAGGAMTPAELGLRLGISESAIASLLAMLATEGRVRICLVERRDATTSTVALVPEAVVALQFLDRRQGEWYCTDCLADAVGIDMVDGRVLHLLAVSMSMREASEAGYRAKAGGPCTICDGSRPRGRALQGYQSVQSLGRAQVA